MLLNMKFIIKIEKFIFFLICPALYVNTLILHGRTFHAGIRPFFFHYQECQNSSLEDFVLL